ncbi:unnamed protein product [Adineta ricciae]|uniref:Uncharacterized protein n=1 Tax=Adineta ricciae TaxID=249248 RepID=A0A815UNL0_ADIRI|nr:unnamed protein product [Adineta ricciae]
MSEMNIPYFDENRRSQFNTKLFQNIKTIQKGIGYDFLIMIVTLLNIPCGVVICLSINWKLSSILLFTIPVIVGSSLITSKLVSNETEIELQTYSTAEHIVQEVINSVRTVFSLNGAKFEQQRYENELDPNRWSSTRKGAIFGIFTGVLSLGTYIVYAIGFIFGSLLILYGRNELNIADNIKANHFQHKYNQQNFGVCFQSVTEGQGAAVSVFQLIDEEREENVNEKGVLEENLLDEDSVPNFIGDIQFKNINLVYPSRTDITALHNLSLTARANRTTALVGSSGSGKSSCMSLLLRFYEPSSGEITINDRSITNYKINQVRENIGIVDQEATLFGMTIYENIRLGKLNATRKEIEEAAKQANAHHFIMKLSNKYDTLVGEHGIQLSGGERQCIALARALVKQPSILLLDEATSALDTVSEKIVQEALDRARKNRTTIIIAHRLTTIQNADKIYVLDKGRVIEEGTHETLMKKEGTYQRTVKKQQIQRLTDNDNNKDNNLIMSGATEEDQKQRTEYHRLLSESELVNMDKDNFVSAKRQFVFLRLLAMNKSEWATILVGCVFSLLSGLCEPLYAILLTKIIKSFNSCDPLQNFHQILISSSIFLLLGIALLIIRFFQFTAFAISGSKLTQRIRAKAFACLLRQEVAYFDRPENSCGAISTRLSSKAAAIQDMSGVRLGVICEAVAIVGFGLLFGLFFSWQLTLIAFFLMILVTSITFLFIYLQVVLENRYDAIIEQASTLAVETLQNIRTVKQLCVEKEILRQYSAMIRKASLMSYKFEFLVGIVTGIHWAAAPLMLLLIYWLSIILIENNKLNQHHVIMVVAFTMFMTESLVIVGTLSSRIGSSISAAQDFFDLFDRTPCIDNASSEGQQLETFRGEIQFEQVKFAYPTRPTALILNKFQLTIKPGQRVALVGTYGCGKTTIIQLLERFYDVTHGQLLIDGVDIRKLNLQWIRSHFGLVSQQPILFDLTIAENITYGLENIPMDDIINAAKKANIHEFIQQLPQGYNTNVGNKGCLLSGGEKQRISIARALLRQPKVLLFDEPTSAMDSHNEQVIQETLEEVQVEDPTRTSIIVAHRLSTIRSCDFICVLDKGHIVEIGTHKELIQQCGNYYQMFTTQHNF